MLSDFRHHRSIKQESRTVSEKYEFCGIVNPPTGCGEFGLDPARATRKCKGDTEITYFRQRGSAQATITHVLGARPNFMKAAPVIRALAALGHEQRIVHTGQHYDERMSQIFFVQLGLEQPDVNLGVGSGSHARQTAEVMIGMEDEFTKNAPSLALLYGDVNSTLGAALAGAKLGIPLAHVEAGLRSFDDSMPEELNRRLTDQLCTLLFRDLARSDRTPG